MHSLAGWWWLEHEFSCPRYWECHHPNWRKHIFQRVAQPPSRHVLPDFVRHSRSWTGGLRSNRQSLLPEIVASLHAASWRKSPGTSTMSNVLPMHWPKPVNWCFFSFWSYLKSKCQTDCCSISTMRGPLVTSWFINSSNCSHKYHKPYSYWNYKPT